MKDKTLQAVNVSTPMRRVELTCRAQHDDGCDACSPGRHLSMRNGTDVVVGHDGAPRNENALERIDRNLVELLQEVRVVQTGVQVLFAFLLTAPLAPRFPDLSTFQRLTYFATLLTAGAAVILLIAPTAYHRILFRLGDKEHLVSVANRFTLAGLTCVAVSITGALLLVTDLIFADAIVVIATTALAAMTCVVSWCLAPLRRRAKLRRGGRAPAAAPGQGAPRQTGRRRRATTT